MTKSIEEMKKYVAECYYDGIDIKDLLRSEYSRIVEYLEAWSDEDIVKEYNDLTDDK